MPPRVRRCCDYTRHTSEPRNLSPSPERRSDIQGPRFASRFRRSRPFGEYPANFLQIRRKLPRPTTLLPYCSLIASGSFGLAASHWTTRARIVLRRVLEKWQDVDAFRANFVGYGLRGRRWLRRFWVDVLLNWYARSNCVSVDPFSFLFSFPLLLFPFGESTREVGRGGRR